MRVRTIVSPNEINVHKGNPMYTGVCVPAEKYHGERNTEISTQTHNTHGLC